VETSYTFHFLIAAPLFKTDKDQYIGRSTASFFSIVGWGSRCLCTNLHGVCVHGHHYTVLKCQNFSFSCRAGSRYEQANTLGITHALRIVAGLTTKDSTQFGIIRNLQQIGATLTCQTDRETIAYTLQSTSDSV
jgi:Predicted Zn-dependent peptidases